MCIEKVPDYYRNLDFKSYILYTCKKLSVNVCNN